MGVTVLRIAAVAAVASLAPAAQGQGVRSSELMKRFSIAAQPLAQALLEFSRQADITVTVSSDLVRGKNVPGVRGEFTPSDALSRLLRGSGLQAFYTASGAVTIGPQREGSSRDQSRDSASNGGSARSPHRDGFGSEDVLEQVFVTAQKRTEDIQRVSSSVSALNSRLLQQLHATTLSHYAGYVSGLNVTSLGSPGQQTITLRGIAPLGPGATVGIYVDDTPLGSSSNYGGGELNLDLLPADVQRMEVLRGPQGTLYGAGAMGGLLKYVLREPDLTDFRLRLGAETSAIANAGELGWGVRAALNAPLRSERLGLWASYARQETPGYIDNAYTHRSDENPVSQQSGRVALRWQIHEALSLKLGGLWQGIDADGNARTSLHLTSVDPPRGTPSYGELTSFHPLAERYRNDLDHYSATLQWELGWASLVAAGGYSRTLTRNLQDTSLIYGELYPQLSDGAVPAGYAPFRIAIDLDKRTQELRLASPSGRLEWLLGAFYTKETSHQYRHLFALDRAYQPIARFAPRLAFSDFHSDYEEIAGFGSITFELNDRLDLTGGVRWARNEQRFRQISGGAQVVVGPPTDFSGSSAENVVTYTASPRLHLGDNTMLYARLATGYRAGGPAPRVRELSSTVNADMLTNYEIGLKMQFPDQRALLNVAMYYIDWSDIQQTLSFGGSGGIQNTGDAVSKGIEIEAALLPFPGWRMDLNAVYSDARLVSSQPGLGNRAGAPLNNVPHWSASALLDYEIAISKSSIARIGAGYRYVGEQGSAFSAQTSIDTSFVRAAYGILDLSAEVARGAWTVSLFARNVLDKRAHIGGGLASTATGEPYGIEVSVLQPRTVGVGVDIVF